MKHVILGTLAAFAVAAPPVQAAALPAAAATPTSDRSCNTYVISSARGPALDFYGAGDKVQQTLRDKNHPGDLLIQVMGCSSKYYFVLIPGTDVRALLRRTDVVLSETFYLRDCTPEQVRQEAEKRHDGNGFSDGLCRQTY